jgi:hypothetical protein
VAERTREYRAVERDIERDCAVDGQLKTKKGVSHAIRVRVGIRRSGRTRGGRKSVEE